MHVKSHSTADQEGRMEASRRDICDGARRSSKFCRGESIHKAVARVSARVSPQPIRPPLHPTLNAARTDEMEISGQVRAMRTQQGIAPTTLLARSDNAARRSLWGEWSAVEPMAPLPAHQFPDPSGSGSVDARNRACAGFVQGLVPDPPANSPNPTPGSRRVPKP